MMSKRVVALMMLVMSAIVHAQQKKIDPLATFDTIAQQKWVDSVYQNMSLQEKIGQLYVVDVFSRKGKPEEDRILKLINEQHIGGVIFSKGGPVTQAKMNNNLQKASKVPLLVTMDAEWGLAMRLDSTFAYPWNMTLGAVENNKLIQDVGYRIGLHAKRLGVHMNFAPDIDINTNPKNPIIGNRSFGESKENVTKKGLAFMLGMQKAGVLANGKHFPGHGDTDQDSHKTLPTISFDEARIDSVELYPYRKLIDAGLASIMVAHLNVPALESRSGYPSSISENVVTKLLKERLGFKGLIFSDALSMKGVSNFSETGDVDLAAFLAGNDVLLISKDIPKGVEKLTQAYNDSIITENRLAHSVKKILKAKYKVGLNNYKPVVLEHLEEDIHNVFDDMLYEEVIENALTVVKNKNDLLPLQDLDKRNIAYIGFGDDSHETFVSSLQNYTQVDTIATQRLDQMMEDLKPYNTIIVGLHRSNESPWKAYEFTEQELVWLYELARQKDVILDVFVKPYALLDLTTTTNLDAIVVSYQNSEVAQEKSAELIFGAIEGKGVLPVTANEDFPVNMCIHTNALSRLRYGIPESVGMDGSILNKIDAIANKVVQQKMAPGMQILVARKGKVIYNKSFGYHTFEKDIPVKNTDLYDLASLTKILASTPMVMKLVDTNAINLRDKLVKLLPELKGSNKANITLLDMMSHTARLKAWIPFYQATLDKFGVPDTTYYSTYKHDKFTVQIMDSLYMREDYKDTVFTEIVKSDLLDRRRYLYSDLGYYFIKKYVEKYYGKGLDEITQQTIYKSLGANHMTYKPLEKFPLEQIIPTEEDNYYRHTKVQGYVHDMGAAMMGGVGGHAGLFSNANDIAKMMQLYIQKGFYGGKRYVKPTTIEKFNYCYFCKDDNRRGVGFDKPQLGTVGPTCGCVPMSSFGHSGFTGTYTWADPENELIYVFLSNRTYPSQDNRKLISQNIRTDIQELIYDAIIN